MNTRIKSGKSFLNEDYPSSMQVSDVILKLAEGFRRDQLLDMHSSVLYLTEFVHHSTYCDLSDEEVRGYIKLFMFELFNDFEDNETMLTLYKERFGTLKFGTDAMESLKSNNLYAFHFSEFVGFFFSWLHSNSSHIDFQSTFNDFLENPLTHYIDESHSLESKSFVAEGKSKSKEGSLC